MKRRCLSGYEGVWLFAMFDLPVDTREARTQYSRFRTLLLKQGFSMLQFSVYARYFASEEACRPHHLRIRGLLPPHGEVRLLAVTDKQFGKMEVFHGKLREKTEQAPKQMLLF